MAAVGKEYLVESDVMLSHTHFVVGTSLHLRDSSYIDSSSSSTSLPSPQLHLSLYDPRPRSAVITYLHSICP
jgi:hypothetical protein